MYLKATHASHLKSFKRSSGGGHALSIICMPCWNAHGLSRSLHLSRSLSLSHVTVWTPAPLLRTDVVFLNLLPSDFHLRKPQVQQHVKKSTSQNSALWLTVLVFRSPALLSRAMECKLHTPAISMFHCCAQRQRPLSTMHSTLGALLV